MEVQELVDAMNELTTWIETFVEVGRFDGRLKPTPDELPVVSVTISPFTESISIGDLCVYDSEESFDSEVMTLVEHCKRNFTDAARVMACFEDAPVVPEDDHEAAKLKQLRGCVDAYNRGDDRRFNEGQIIGLTTDMAEHPEWMEGIPCYCDSCREDGCG